MKSLVSVVIPVYNEKKDIEKCLSSLLAQDYPSFEVIVIDDGSNDGTIEILKKFVKESDDKIKLLKQNHLGPGPARNLGARHAKGEILSFVDADMTFEKDFLSDLVVPILEGKTIGTFSKNEMNGNSDNAWSLCWNINKGLPKERLIPEDYPQEAPVFRAILKKEFERVGGFDNSGEYTDDWSLSRKLKVKSSLAKGAVYYHLNPSTLSDVWKQARWIGKNYFISGNFIRRTKSLIFYSFPFSVLIGIYKSVFKRNILFPFFKIVYDFGVWVSVVKAFLGESKAK